MPLKDIESAEITCSVDNSVDILLPNTKVAFRPSLNENWFVHPLIAEHGFCAAIKLQVNGTEHRLLFDSGLDPLTASHNAGVLGFDLSNCELVISSHDHIDHAGGLLNIKRKINEKKEKQKLKQKQEQKLPIVLHKDAFKNRLVKFQDGRHISLPAPNRADLIKAGYNLVEKQSPSLRIEDRILVTGEIPRTNDFEKGFPNHYSEIDGKMENDPLIKDDQAIILSIKDKGLVVITGCAHAGIINIIKYAKELSREDRIYGVIGGMHHSGHWHEHSDGGSHEHVAGPPPSLWKHDGVRVIPGNQLDANTAQTPGMDRKAAINFARVGAQKLWAGTVTIHAKAKTGAHHHGHLESMIYIVKGRVRMRWGGHLEFMAEAGPGDFIYVPPYVPHQEINASPTEMLECVLCRSDGEAVAVNLDIEPVEKPEQVLWVDPTHPKGSV